MGSHCGALLVALTLCACSTAGADEEPVRPPRTLVLADAWEIDLDDPFPEHQPDEIDCPPTARRPEYGSLEVSTGTCNYAALAQPLMFDLHPDDVLAIEVFHDALQADAPAKAHIAVAVDAAIVWDQQIPIPSAAQPYRVEVTPELDAPAGTPIRFHLHNHGYNTWKLLDVAAFDPRQE